MDVVITNLVRNYVHTRQQNFGVAGEVDVSTVSTRPVNQENEPIGSPRGGVRGIYIWEHTNTSC